MDASPLYEPEVDEPLACQEQQPAAGATDTHIDALCAELERDRRSTPALVRVIMALQARGAHHRLANVLREQLKVAPTSAELWNCLYTALEDSDAGCAARQALEEGIAQHAGFGVWRFYLRNALRLMDPRPRLDKYGQALAHVSHDIDMGDIVADLIDILETHDEHKLGVASCSALIRTAYESLLGHPHARYAELARRYENWERANNPGRYFVLPRETRELMERMTRVSEQLTALWRATPRAHYMPPTPADPAAAAHVAAWRRLLAAERENRARLPPAEHAERMQYVWAEYVRQMFFYDSAWDEYAKWTRETRGVEQAAAVYRAALRLRPDADLLRHELAQMLERAGDQSGAADVYADWLDARPSAAAWCCLLQFRARTGAAADVRREFLRATHCATCDWRVYLTMAQLELCVQREPRIAIKICEKAMPQHQSNLDFVMAYIDIVTYCGDTAETAAVYERALAAIADPADRRHLLGRYLRYARLSCNPIRIADVERRCAAEPGFEGAGLATLFGVAAGAHHGASLVGADEARAIERGGVLEALAPRLAAGKRAADDAPAAKRARRSVSTENAVDERPDDVFVRRAAERRALRPSV